MLHCCAKVSQGLQASFLERERESATEGISWFCFERISLNRGIKSIMNCSCLLWLAVRLSGHLPLVPSHTKLTAQNGHNASFLGKFRRKLWKFQSLNYNSSCKTNHVNRKLRRTNWKCPNFSQIWTHLPFLQICPVMVSPCLWSQVLNTNLSDIFFSEGLKWETLQSSNCSWWRIEIAIVCGINPLFSYFRHQGRLV